MRALWQLWHVFSFWTGTSYLPRRPNYQLQSVLVLSSGRSKSDSDGGAEDRQDDGSVESDQQLLWLVKFPELSQKVQLLLSLLVKSLC